MKINLEIPDSLIEDWVVTALEGGIDYWGWVSNLSLKEIKAQYYSEEDFSGIPIAVLCARWLIEGEILLMSTEDGQREWMTMGAIERSLNLMLEKGHESNFGNLFSGQFDVWDVDALFQFALFGEMVYG